MPQIQFPIESVLPELRNAIARHRNVVVSAEPGAGKTTRIPLVMLAEPWCVGKKIIMLEPRRLAAQRAAAFMAQQLGEKVGVTIGYRTRGESKVGAATRLEVVTEGILTRLLQDDPALPDVALVIFDEFHERSIHADLGLALTLDVQQHLRNDLRVMVMSATIDGTAVASILGDAEVIRSEGRGFPVTTHYLSDAHLGSAESLVGSTVMRSLTHDTGDILVFLPGQAEIRRVEQLLTEKLHQLDGSDIGERNARDVEMHTLFGDAPLQKQQAALAPAATGKRKVILSTSIAETSLTIDGVRIVIDSGLARSSRFDPRRGMSGLVTTPVSQASADQRRGRAGRQGPGVCYRLWTEQQQSQLQKFAPPEILLTDLAPLALELARWGAPTGEGLHFLDLPPVAHLQQARNLLTSLGAIDHQGNLSEHGRMMANLPVHPRLANMLVQGKTFGWGPLACEVAALLEERDLLAGEYDTDVALHSRWHALHVGKVRNNFLRERVQLQANRLRKIVGVRGESADADQLGILLALAYPERVARQRERGGNRYQMVGGSGAVLPKGSMLSRERYLAIGDVDGIRNEVKIFLAEPIDEDEIRNVFPDQLTTDEEVQWDEQRQQVVARSVTRFGAIELSESSLTHPSEKVLASMLDGVRRMGLSALPWKKSTISLRTRSEWLRIARFVSADWPNLNDDHLLSTIDVWLAPYLDGITKRTELARLDLHSIISNMFSYCQLQELDRLAPTHLTVPTGSRIQLEYTESGAPILAIRLQEMFGETGTPSVANGRVKVVIHLLSPARRPLAVTQDLPSFWKNAYPDVRKEMRGRYPKHYWPENPLEATPTRRTKH